jgi:hypothetical protein
MSSNHVVENSPPATNAFSAADVAAILREHKWLPPESQSACDAWLASAAALLGPQAPDRAALADLLGLIFQYDARAILQSEASHTMLARDGAREVIRSLAHLVLDGPAVDSDRFKAIISSLKNSLPYRGRELFGPIRISLAGRAGEGELDRVILLLDSAAALPFSVAVKGTRQRMLEFCAAL